MNLRKTGILLAWAMIIAANGTAQNVQRTSQGIKYAAQGMNVIILGINGTRLLAIGK